MTDTLDSHVVGKLLGFTAAMIVMPIGSFFMSINTIFQGALRPNNLVFPNIPTHVNDAGNTTYAGALAAFMANVVLVSYIFVAMAEDDGSGVEAGPPGKETKKSL